MHAFLKRCLISIYYRLNIRILHQYLKKKIVAINNFIKYYNSQKTTEIRRQYNKILKKARVSKRGKGVLLTQMVQDHHFTTKIAALSKILAEKYGLNVYVYDVYIHESLGWNNPMHKYYVKWFKTQNEKTYLSFAKGVLFSVDVPYKDQKLIKRKLDFYSKQINSPEDVLRLKFDDIYVGDLLYDTYLRYFDVPTITQINENVIRTLEIGLNIYYTISDLLLKRDVKCLINTYVAYFQHGLIVRMCLNKGIEVYTIGSINYLVQKLTIDFPWHVINHTVFDPEELLDTEIEEKIKSILKNRFSGKPDQAVSYLINQAYSLEYDGTKLDHFWTINKRNVVIYVHEFQDQPHENRNLCVNDLYQWLKLSLDAMNKIKGTTFFVKIHPSAFPKSKVATRELVASYDNRNFVILDEHVKNNYIIERKPDLVATVWGTVGLEMAYFEIPVITLYDNPYINYNFVHNCYDLITYHKIMAGEISPKINFDKKYIYRYYYQLFMKYLPFSQESIHADLFSLHLNSYSDDYLKELLSKGLERKWKDFEISYKDFLESKIQHEN